MSRSDGVGDLARRFVVAVQRWLGQGAPMAPVELRRRRLEVCAACPSLVRGPVARCGECGCAVAAKARMMTEGCPIGRWPRA